MKWFQIKEQAAGKKRLILTWYLYKIFGKNIVYAIALLMALLTFFFSGKVRGYSKKYFSLTYPILNIKPSLINQFKHIYAFANSIADRILLYCGDFDCNNIIFENEDAKNNLMNNVEEGKGAFFIFNHIGNIEILQTYLLKNVNPKDFCVNIFMSYKQSNIFKDFIEKIQVDFPVKMFAIEDIGIKTGITLKESLEKGNVAFIAGDRVAENNDSKNIKVEILNNTAYFPKGTYTFAKLMEVPIYFISAAKYKDKYTVYIEEQKSRSENELAVSFAKFSERIAKIHPFQFFHFFDFFVE